MTMTMTMAMAMPMPITMMTMSLLMRMLRTWERHHDMKMAMTMAMLMMLLMTMIYFSSRQGQLSSKTCCNGFQRICLASPAGLLSNAATAEPQAASVCASSLALHSQAPQDPGVTLSPCSHPHALSSATAEPLVAAVCA